jgi:hypothetical protein
MADCRACATLSIHALPGTKLPRKEAHRNPSPPHKGRERGGLAAKTARPVIFPPRTQNRLEKNRGIEEEEKTGEVVPKCR